MPQRYLLLACVLASSLAGTASMSSGGDCELSVSLC